MTDHEDEACWCEQTETSGEQLCPPCEREQAAYAAAHSAEGDQKTNALLHYITGGDFL